MERGWGGGGGGEEWRKVTSQDLVFAKENGLVT